MTAFAELAVTTNFSFLRGGSHPEELVRQAAKLKLAGIAVADRNTLAGVVRGHVMAKEIREEHPGFRYAVGCRLAFRDACPDILAWPTDRDAYGRLCRLLTLGNRRAEKGECHLDLADLLEWGEGMMLGVVPNTRPDDRLDATLARLEETFPDAVRLMLTRPHGASDHRRMALVAETGRRFGVPLLATSDVLYHVPERRPLQDVLTCIREKKTLLTAGRLLQANAERHLKGAAEMARLFRDFPEAVAESRAVLERLEFSLDQLRYQYPDEPTGDAASPQEALERLTEIGAKERYPGGVPESVKKTLAHELGLIARLNYAPYFLTVHDIVTYARSQKILCQGRGSAANSAVCYCLGITEVDPAGENSGLLFERFVSAERNEPPDIDVDFEHERREIVMQYIYEKYSRERTGLAATVITYRSRSALREVGKVFGLSEDAVGALSGSVWGWSSEKLPDDDVRRAGLDPKEPTIRRVLELAAEVAGFPRHLSQHVGGFVMTRDRLDEIVPIANAAMEDRTTVEWDKDDLDALRILKVDVLALGMLTCIRRAFEFMKEHYRQELTIAAIRREEDKAVYDMLCRADSLGTFQVESRAQMSMLPRLRPRKFYDLVVEVAIVRPGPIQGGMVHPYLKRRQGIEETTYPSPAPGHGHPDELREVLGKTLGVPLFQEQAMRIAIVAASFAPGEANELCRAMATFRRVGTIDKLKERFITGMTRKGYARDFAERCFSQIEGFGDYGFPESHAASFAILVYVSAWLKCHYPDVFCAAILNSQPMGFYAPAQLVRDAREHGIEVRPVDVNLSDWDCTLEPDDGVPAARLHRRHVEMEKDIRSTRAVRLGFRQITGFSEDDGKALCAVRNNGYDSVRDLWLRTGLTRAAIERLADADAFRSIGLDRRDALWAARGESAGKAKDRLPLFDVAEHRDIRKEPDFHLPPMPVGEHVVNDYRYLSLSLKAHPLSFLRERLSARRIVTNASLRETPNTRGEDGRRPDRETKNGDRVAVAGLVIIRQRPGTANGVIFMTLEDETDIANVIVWPKMFERYRPVVLGARLVAVTGRMQSESGVIHVVADRIEDLTPMLAALSEDAGDLSSLARADEVARPSADNREKITHPRMVRFFQKEPSLARDLAALSTHKVMPKGRNFH
jgi:error-prone DNA polymerase